MDPKQGTQHLWTNESEGRRIMNVLAERANERERTGMGTGAVKWRTLTQARIAARLTMPQLAERAAVSVSTVFEIERRAVKPRLSTILKISAALGIEPESIAWPGDPLGVLQDDVTPMN